MGGRHSKNDDEDAFVTVQPSSVENAEPPRYVKPTFAAARDHFNNSLPHRIEEKNQKTGYRLARQGEMMSADGKPAVFYDLFASEESLNEFGIGISLYYKTLKWLFLVIVVCALISLVAIY